ncbi:MAG: hydrolase [Herbinix sp.]|jgi:8-oxo-dGTP pyrophosphatase MutT (NUDIX family)|nr:hydrolase [Herbinix sp.]
MHKIDILGLNRFEHPSKERIGCRGIIIQNSQILLVHELKNDFYMIPGGGHEPGETLEECCTRELQEETGYVVKPCKEGAFLQLIEYYEEYKYINYYFTCEIIGTATRNLTEAEAERNLVSEWVDMKMALDIFSHHQDYASTYEEKRGAYLREYTALHSAVKMEMIKYIS